MVAYLIYYIICFPLIATYYCAIFKRKMMIKTICYFFALLKHISAILTNFFHTHSSGNSNSVCLVSKYAIRSMRAIAVLRSGSLLCRLASRYTLYPPRYHSHIKLYLRCFYRCYDISFCFHTHSSFLIILRKHLQEL